MYVMNLFAADPYGWQSHQRGGSTLSGNWFLVLSVVVIGLFWVGVYLWDRYRKNNLRNSDRPKSLFLELCQAHELSRSERNLLVQAAESKALEQEAIIFLDRSIIGEFANSSNPDATNYSALLKKLFGSETSPLISESA